MFANSAKASGKQITIPLISLGDGLVSPRGRKVENYIIRVLKKKGMLIYECKTL